MKRFWILFLLCVPFMWAQDAKFEYVGSAKCKMCHKHQFGAWEKGLHIGAMETLKSEQSKKIAEEMKLNVPAWQAPECLSCHATGFGSGGFEVKDEKFWAQTTDKGKPTKDVKRMTGLKGVGCEGCHGPGSEYKSKKVMKAITVGTTDGASVGLIEPNEALCISCHNEKSPTYKKFVFAERIKEVAHPTPEDKKK